MSDPAKEPDIEDVLASVRRLVTAERRERPAASSALVLTPSQRIERPSFVPTPSEEEAHGDDAAIDAAPDAESDVARTLSETHLADAEWEEDEPQDAFTAWRGDGGDEGEDSGEADAAAALSDIPTLGSALAGEGEDESSDEAESWDIEADSAAEATALSVEAALDAAEDADDFEAPDAGDEIGEDSWRVAFRHDPHPEMSRARPADMDAPAVPAEPEAAPAGDHAKLDHAEPEDAGFDVVEDVELDTVTDVDPDTVEDAEIVGEESAPEHDLLDEEALRAMISDIVREELRGSLGERITSNVRKLVRREIHRTLAAREFE